MSRLRILWSFARYQVTSDSNVADPNSEQIVLTIGPFETSGNHFGGELAFGPDGYLYFGVGTGSGAAPDSLGQDLTVLRGKLLRIDVETGDPATYTIPSSNPYVGDPNARPEIWAVGLRNPWRSSFDPHTGDHYIADVGQALRPIRFPSGLPSRKALGSDVWPKTNETEVQLGDWPPRSTAPVQRIHITSHHLIRLAIPQPTEWHRIGNQIDAASVFARAYFVCAFFAWTKSRILG